MRDVHVLLRVHDDERPPVGGELVQHRSHGRRHGLSAPRIVSARRNGHELGEGSRTPDLPVVPVAIGEPLEDLACHRAMVVARQAGVNLVRVPVERVMNRLHRRQLVVLEIDLATGGSYILRHIPHTHQRVLQHGQLVVVVLVELGGLLSPRAHRPSREGINVVQEPLHQPRGNPATAHRHRPLDRLSQLFARHPGHRNWLSFIASGSPENRAQSPR